MDRLSRLIAATALAVVAVPGCGAPASDEPSPAARWLAGYLQVDTTNPPGREAAAADYLEQLVAGTPLETTRLDAGDGRVSWLATLPATEPAAPLLLLVHHSDVVPAGEGWRRDPFSGAIVDGEIWGRGAIDSKGLGVAHLAAVLAAAERTPRRRAVAVLAAADEETGGDRGVRRWLEPPAAPLAGVDAVLNEGGVNRSFRGRLHWWGIETIQKRPLWLEVTAPTPSILVAALDSLLATEPTWTVTPTSRRIFGGLSPLYNEHWRGIFDDLDAAIEPSGPRRRLLPGMASYFLDSLQVNRLEVLADGRGRASVDLRLLPETDAARVLRDVRQRLGGGVEVEIRLAAPVIAASPFDHPLIELLRGVLEPEGPVVEQMISGVTDSRHFRRRGVPAYGFSPFLLDPEVTATVHADDERIPLAAFERGVVRMTEVVARWVDGD